MVRHPAQWEINELRDNAERLRWHAGQYLEALSRRDERDIAWHLRIVIGYVRQAYGILGRDYTQEINQAEIFEQYHDELVEAW